MPDDDLPAVLAAGRHLSPMSRTVDRVPKRAETDWLRLLGDTGIDLDREVALLRYAHHFDLDDGELDRHGMLRQFIQGTAIAASAAVLMPHRMTFPGAVVASLGLEGSEQPVWLLTMRSTAWALCQRIRPRPSREWRRSSRHCLTTRRSCSWVARSPARAGRLSPPDQPERLAVFQSGDGWFTYNLVRNLAASAP